MPPSKLVTQADVARAAGVNRATVSLAVRNHPSISPATRDRIQKIAAELGYRLDPMLSALATYRNSQRPPEYRGTLAWIAHTTEKFRWRMNAHFSAYFAAAQKRAAFHGYRIDVLDLGESGMTLDRAASVLRSRGIRGIMLCPQPQSETDFTGLPWDSFAGITFGYSITRPRLHAVAAAQFRAAFATYREVQSRGYRRIALALNRGHDERTDHNYLGGYLAARELHAEARSLPPFLYDQHSLPTLPDWVRRHKPDALLCANPIPARLREAGWNVPDDLGIANPLLASDTSDISGMWESNERIADAAVDMVVAMLHRGEYGIPERPQRVLIDSVWIEGASLRPAVMAAR